MKTYHEMVQFTVDKIDDGTLRYNEWQPVLVLAETYGIPQAIVFNDIKFEKEFREKARKEQRKIDSRAANEARRLANIAKKATEQSWRDNPDRSGGQFTQDEIDNVSRWDGEWR